MLTTPHWACTPSAVARQWLKAEAMADHIDVAAGDFFHDPIPGGHDAVIVSHVIHAFPPERNRMLLERLRRRVPGGARLLLVDYWTDPTHRAALRP